MEKARKNIVPLLLLAIIIGGFLLRIYHLQDNIFFAYDQARDAERVYEMSKGNLKLVGPETDIPGLFHGALFYYLLLPTYILSDFNPNFAALLFVFFDTFGIVLIYFTGKRIGRSRAIGLLSSLLWAVSYQQLNFARFISNVSILSLTTTLFFLGLYLLFIEKKRVGLFIGIIGLSLSIHTNLVCLYLIPFFLILWVFYRTKISLKDIVINLLFFIALISSFIVAEIKHGFIGIKSFVVFLRNMGGSEFALFQNISRYVDRLNDSITYNFSTLPTGLNILLFSLVCIYVFSRIKNKKRAIFMFVWIFSTIPLFFFNSGILNSPSINGIVTGAMFILTAHAVYYLYLQSQKKIVLPFIIVSMILVSNFILLQTSRFIPISLFAYQNSTLKNVKDVVSYTYQNTQKEPFGICSVSNPLFINTLWSFAYNHLRPKTYDYIPYWTGPKQWLNANNLPYLKSHENDVSVIYLILEPSGGIPKFAPDATIYLLDQKTELVGKKIVGDFEVQKRILTMKTIDNNLPPGELTAIISKEPRFSCYVTD